MRHGSRLRVHLNYLEENYRLSQGLSHHKEALMMVKANAYGHGICEVSEFAHHELEIKNFGVATTGEGILLRETLKSREFEIYLFSDYELQNEKEKSAILSLRLIPVLYSISSLKTFLSDRDYSHVPLCLKFNTGMNRLGISMLDLSKALELIQSSGRKRIDHLMSHFANASLSLEHNKRNQLQMQNFKEVISSFKGAGIEIDQSSMDNSGAIEQENELKCSHTRPGLMLYGASALIQEPTKALKILSSWELRVLHHFQVERGEPVGYGANPVQKEGWVCVMNAGYGDGLMNLFSGCQVRSENGEAGVVLKPINMDMIQVWFSKLPKLDQRFYLWRSGEKDFFELLKHAKMIPYELMCLVGQRVPRSYVRSSLR